MVSLDNQVDPDLDGLWQIAEPSNDPEQGLLEREEQFQEHQAVKDLPVPLRTVLWRIAFKTNRSKNWRA